MGLSACAVEVESFCDKVQLSANEKGLSRVMGQPLGLCVFV